jgi:acetolactate synthase-1/2/3 large subunit
VDNRDPHRGSKLFLATVPTDRDAAGPWTPGWLDWPVPTYVTDERAEQYLATKVSEQHY